MDFESFRDKMREHFRKMVEGKDRLFIVEIPGDELWDLYLNSFAPGDNPQFRERTEHDCEGCKQFVRQFGGVVAINDNYQIVSIWDFDAGAKYQPVVDALSKAVHTAAIENQLITKQSAFGVDKNVELLDGDGTLTWYHFQLDVPSRFLTRGHLGRAANEARADKEVFERSLNEISPEAVDTVLDLIAEKSLYRGDEWKPALTAFRQAQQEYSTVENKDAYLWLKSYRISGAASRLRNHSMGVLLTDIEGGDVVEAVKRYESIVAPRNYKRPKPVHTRAMVKRAERAAEDLGILGSLERRYARIDDIHIKDVIWANPDAVTADGDLSPFKQLASDAPVSTDKFEHLPGISVEFFVDRVLPGATSIEALLENRHERNLVSLTAPVNLDAPTLFKWENPFGWAYNGNVTSSIRNRVKELGGKIGVLRFSLAWDHNDDLDAHVIEPGGTHIYWQRMRSGITLGNLDIDIIHPDLLPDGQMAVENITYPVLHRMVDGVYKLFVRCYTYRGGTSGFRAEVEIDGQIHEFEYNKAMRTKEDVQVAKIVVGNEISIDGILESSVSQREMWGLKSGTFVPVSAVTWSPNYWSNAAQSGHRHLFFFLQGAQADEEPSGFFNEYLPESLRPHRRVFEALVNRMKVAPDENQLSGIGFSTTERNSLVLKVDGRPVKVVF
jgi:hypothetical protein